MKRVPPLARAVLHELEPVGIVLQARSNHLRWIDILLGLEPENQSIAWIFETLAAVSLLVTLWLFGWLIWQRTQEKRNVSPIGTRYKGKS